MAGGLKEILTAAVYDSGCRVHCNFRQGRAGEMQKALGQRVYQLSNVGDIAIGVKSSHGLVQDIRSEGKDTLPESPQDSKMKS